VGVGDGDRSRRIFRAQAIEVPSGSANRVEHAVSSARFYGTPALDEGYVSGTMAALVGEAIDALRRPVAHHMSGSTVLALGRDVSVAGSGGGCSPEPGRY